MGRALALSAIGLTVLAVACSGSESGGGDLEANPWELSSILSERGELVAPIPSAAITAQFAQSEVSGDSGCNRYNGGYTTEGDAIDIGPLASTRRACQDPVNAQEARYLDLFQASVRYEIADNQLSLFDDAGTETLVYVTLEPIALAGTSWEAISVNDGNQAVVSLIPGTEITATFGNDGSLTGNGGCNGYSAPFEAGPDTISVGAVGATRSACSDPAGVMEQEQSFFAALENSDTWIVSSGRLELRDADGALQVNFNPSDSG